LEACTDAGNRLEIRPDMDNLCNPRLWPALCWVRSHLPPPPWHPARAVPHGPATGSPWRRLQDGGRPGRLCDRVEAKMWREDIDPVGELPPAREFPPEPRNSQNARASLSHAPVEAARTALGWGRQASGSIARFPQPGGSHGMAGFRLREGDEPTGCRLLRPGSTMRRRAPPFPHGRSTRRQET